MATLIHDATELQAMSADMAGDYEVANDIDASATVGWNGGLGFEPVGTGVSPFTGTLNVKGYTISDLYINRPAAAYTGLFGKADGATIQDCILANVNIVGDVNVGSLVGMMKNGIMSNSSSSGSITGIDYVGGLVGDLTDTSISDSFSSVNITAEDYVGGLIGLVRGGSLNEVFATGDVSGINNLGGLVGYFWDGATAANIYARGDVTGNDCVAGLIGVLSSDTLSDSYSTGQVNGNTNVGGLIGSNSGTVTNCFWDTQTSGQAASDGGTGKTTAQMKTKSTFSGWDFSLIWSITSFCNNGYPCLQNVTPNCALIPSIQGPQVKEIVALEAIRNIEMSCMGRAYIDEEGNLTYESRYARNP